MPTTRIEFPAAFKFGARTFLSRRYPIMAQIVVTPQCNLSCGYCTEYTKTASPVPTEHLLRRIDKLAALKTGIVTCTGGEPLLHPELARVVTEIRLRGAFCSIITNGLLLDEKRIEELNSAGLHQMQLSIDNIEPDEISQKSLRIAAGTLELLARLARFHVNVNTVLEITDRRVREAEEIGRVVEGMGFSHSVQLMHDRRGKLRPLTATQQQVFVKLGKFSRSWIQYLSFRIFQRKLISGETTVWKCRAGARYLYVSADGLVHWCAQQKGYPAIPLEDYSLDDIRRGFRTRKSCSPRCSLNCVHQLSFVDEWRGKQDLPDPRGQAGESAKRPSSV